MPETEITHEQADVRYRQMRQRLAAIKSEILELVKARWEAKEDSDRLDDAARRLLDGAEPDVSNIELRLQKLRAEAEVVGRAVDIARGVVQKHQKAKNKAVVRELRPEHRLAAARVQLALAELSAACDAEKRIRLQAPSVGLSLPMMGFPGIDSMSDYGSQVREFLRYCARHGYDHDISDPRMRAAAE